ncbi:MAG: bifunctional diaminohydroxyphosphoribosylaminopyrimidine deaminase/5-amino-6-(5-phosphoribosylamino)uracil reductase RibD [Clostridium sp.]|nr:bifunctional diaminohydroxyphosphoribosylaminopyrimidine deaminase/5-amino-6-(5-phosphoribosylamino)uracil reductase RibD [Clostridium sp.]
MMECYMQRALELAKKGEGFVNPNPLVGAVIVKDNKVIGEGYHEVFGKYHAEVNALKMAGKEAKDAEVYVTLEPCSHYGKTPPCAEALVKAGVKKVVIAMKDPNPMVSGRGIEILENSGIEVVCGVLEQEAKQLNEIFIKYIITKLPFVIMKTAMTMDGKIATVTGESKWISGKVSREYVHKIRNRVMGIMVGIGTVLMDDPMLTTRLDSNKVKSPTAVILDSKLRIPLDAKILETLRERDIIIATTENADRDKKIKLENLGIKFITAEDEEGKVDIEKVIRKLGNMGIDSVLLEGGSNLNFSAVKSGVVDKVICFIAPKIVGGEKAKTPVEGGGISNINDAIKLYKIKAQNIGEDILIEGYMYK